MCRIKSPFLGHFHPFFLAGPLGAGLVKWSMAALLPLVTGLKINDFFGQSSFATASKSKLNTLAFSAHFADNCRESYFVDRAHSVCAEAEGDEAVFFRKPESFFHKVRLKAALFDAGYFKTDPFFLLCNTADGVAVPANRDFSSHLTTFRHGFSLQFYLHNRRILAS